jgi:hypothetical protein
MPSTYTGLGVQLMTTGEKAGTWGTLTNTNWNIMEQISGGYIVQTLNADGTGANTTTLSVNDGTTGATLANKVVILGAESAQAITGNKIVTIPLDVEQFYLVQNNTTGAYTVQFKYVSGSDGGVTWAADDKGWKILYASANDGTNPVLADTGFGGGDVTLTGTQTLTNKTLTSPKIGTSILDTNGLQLALLTATSSAVNEITLANAASGSNPTLTASGDDANIGISLATKGSGVIKAEDGGGTVSAVKIAGKETIWVPALAMYPTTTNGCAAVAQVEGTAQRPEIKACDFDASSDEFAQFAVTFPKSWNEGTVTFQTFWSVTGTNTGTVCFQLAGGSIANDAAIDTAYGTAVANTALAASGTASDLMVNAESGAVTIANAAADTWTSFQINRDVSADDQTADARLLGIKLFFTTDAANDV